MKTKSEKPEVQAACITFLNNRFPNNPPPMEFSKAEQAMMKTPAQRVRDAYADAADPALQTYMGQAASGHLFNKGGAK